MMNGRLFSAMDLKVGFRMLTRYPGLTALSIDPTEALRAEA